MKKEILTKETIELDIKNVYTKNIRDFSILTIVSWIAFVIEILFFANASKNTNIYDYVILIITAILSIGATLYLVFYIKDYLNPKYTIQTDHFVKTGKKAIFGSVWGMPCLCFSKYGKFILGFYDKYYQWSENYPMSSYGIKNTSIPGEEFYLIIINNKIINVYNKKLFELKE